MVKVYVKYALTVFFVIKLFKMKGRIFEVGNTMGDFLNRRVEKIYVKIIEKI